MAILAYILLQYPLIFFCLLCGSVGWKAPESCHRTKPIATAPGARASRDALAIISFANNSVICEVKSPVSRWVDFEVIKIQTAKGERSVGLFFWAHPREILRASFGCRVIGLLLR
jgi:hypothetical protein